MFFNSILSTEDQFKPSADYVTLKGNLKYLQILNALNISGLKPD